MTDWLFTSARLGFRRWTNDDLPFALALWSDPEVTRWIDARARFTEEDVRDRLAREIAYEREHGVQYWPAFLLDGGAHVGCCGLHPRDRERGVFEIGIHLRRERWGGGYAVEISRAVIAHAFDTVGATALFAGHHPDNDASRHLLPSLGFRSIGTEFYAPTGRDHPSYLLAADQRGEHDRDR